MWHIESNETSNNKNQFGHSRVEMVASLGVKIGIGLKAGNVFVSISL